MSDLYGNHLSIEGAQNAQCYFATFSQDFGDFESSYLWNGSRDQQMVKSILLGFQWSFM